ncbi:helix-turn-helix domain-containing protein [Nocardia flavorosea]|uniref:AraC-like ligand-binding domain-containing protein n=1 Tax=Nocardia flavorosea TaxID=53429 RepID=UPI0018940ED0|nr:helix-turn-helix domain-containing protein [Nocardia flavorosea]MBF6350170.1 helix-turn-helix domain-containing protein [Nocardia flavorosea]
MFETVFVTEKASTHGLSAQESQEEWRRMTTRYQCDMQCDFSADQQLVGALTTTRTRMHQLLTWQSSSVRYRRTPKHIRRDGIDSYMLLLPGTGTANVDRGAVEFEVSPGRAAMLSATEPFEVTHSPGAELRVLTIDRQSIEHRMNRRFDLAAPLDLATGLGLVVQDLIQSILRSLDQLSADQFDAAVSRLIELLCVLIGENIVQAGDHFGEIEAAIRRYVRDHAHEPDLNAAVIAGALGWSVRQIQLSMQRAGTTARDLIREERLSLAHERLTGPAFRGTSITDVAHQCGFTSATTFSTAFRQRFGITPRELRGIHLHPLSRTSGSTEN